MNENWSKEIIDRSLARGRSVFRRRSALRYGLWATGLWLSLPALLFFWDMASPLEESARGNLALLWQLGWGIHLLVALFLAFVLPLDAMATARRMERLDPTLDSSLTNGRDLLDQARDEGLGERTRDLARQAIDAYGERLRDWSPKRILENTRQPHLRWLPLVGLAVLLLPAFWGWQVYVNQWQRFMDPAGFHPPWSNTTLTLIEPVVEPSVIRYGKDLTVRVGWTGTDPREMDLLVYPEEGDAPLLRLPMFNKGELGFDQRLENLVEPVYIQAMAGDGRSRTSRHRVEIQMIPLLEKTEVEVQPPAYTGRPPWSGRYDGRALRLLQGSRVEFSFHSNRPLVGGHAIVRRVGGKVVELPLIKGKDNTVVLEHAPEMDAWFAVVLKDVDGYVSETLEVGQWKVIKDMPPRVQIAHPTRDTFVSMGYALEVKVEASDDIGLKQLRVHRMINGFAAQPMVLEVEKGKDRFTHLWPVDLKNIGVESGDVLQVYAEVIDNSPQGQMAVSDTRSIRIISEEEYNDYLRERSEIDMMEKKYTELMNRYAEMLEDHQKIGEALAALSDEEVGGEAWKDLLQQQENLEKRMHGLAEEMETFGREKPLYDVEKEFQQMFKAMAHELHEAMDRQELGRLMVQKELAEGQISPQQAREKLAQQHRETSEELSRQQEQADDDIGQTIEDLSKMQALIQDFQMLGRLTQKQMEIATRMKAHAETEHLDRAGQLALQLASGEQAEVERLLEQLRQNLKLHAEQAQDVFPRAAQSGFDLLENIGNLGLTSQAQRSTRFMRMGDGPQSWQVAEHLSQDLQSLCSNCNGQQAGMSSEMDAYLRLMMGMEPGQTFSQMMKSGLFQMGRGNSSRGFGMGMPNMEVLGSEPSHSPLSGPGEGQADRHDENQDPELQLDKVEETQTQERHRVKTRAIDAGGGFLRYQDVVDEYFKAVEEEKP